MVAATKEVRQAQSIESLVARLTPFIDHDWREVMQPCDLRRGQHYWAVRQLLRVAESERITGRRVEYVLGDESPADVLSILCPEYRVTSRQTTSQAGNQWVTHTFYDFSFKGNASPVIAIDFTLAGYEPEAKEVLDMHNESVRITATLHNFESINGRVIATYVLEGEVR